MDYGVGVGFFLLSLQGAHKDMNGNINDTTFLLAKLAFQNPNPHVPYILSLDVYWKPSLIKLTLASKGISRLSLSILSTLSAKAAVSGTTYPDLMVAVSNMTVARSLAVCSSGSACMKE